MKRGWVLVLCFLLFSTCTSGKRRTWSEDEEAKYLQDLKERELKQFENEMRDQSQNRGGRYGMQMMQMGSPVRQLETELPKELRPSKSIGKDKLMDSPLPRHEALKSAAEPMVEVDEFGNEEYWCYHCASPIDKLRTDVRKSIRNLLEMRRTTFPTDVVTPECLTARDLSKLKKQKCSYKFCQSLSILDRNAGNAFVVRGCAEHFGAINLPELEKKPDHSCEMLHEKLEIKECICKTAKYCNAGWRKRSSNDASITKGLGTFAFLLIIANLWR